MTLPKVVLFLWRDTGIWLWTGVHLDAESQPSWI